MTRKLFKLTAVVYTKRTKHRNVHTSIYWVNNFTAWPTSSTLQHPGGSLHYVQKSWASKLYVHLVRVGATQSVQRLSYGHNDGWIVGSIPVRGKGFYLQSVHTRPVLGATPCPVNGNREP